MENYKSIKDIKRDYDVGNYFCHMQVPKKVSDNHVFDENLSVKKNREMAREHNENVQKLKEEKREKNRLLAKTLSEDVVKYIQNEYRLSKKTAVIIERYVYDERHSHMPDYFAYIDEISELVSKIVSEKL